MADKTIREAVREYAFQQPPPAYFVEMTIENFRCFGPKQTLKLGDKNGVPYQWTVLVGENGSGKTTLLQLLALLKPTAHRTLSSNQVISTPLLYSKILDEEWSFRPRDLGVKAEAHCWLRVGDKMHMIKRGKPDVDFGVEFEASLVGSSYVPQRLGATQLPESGFDLACFGYGPYRRAGGQQRLAFPVEIAGLFSDDAMLAEPEGWLLQADYSDKRHGRSNNLSLFGRVEQILIDLLPDLDRLIIEDVDGATQAVVVADTRFGRRRLNELSLGYQSTLAWAVDLASRLFERHPLSDDPLAEPAIVLIDEVDLHLHPKWQRQFFDIVSQTFKNTQFVVTTHSPLVIQAIPDANIVLLKAENDYTTIVEDLQYVRSWRVDQILTSDLFDLPTARPPHLDLPLQERARILSKPQLSQRDRARLKQLDRNMSLLPGGESRDDLEAMEVIRRAAQLIKNREASGS